MQNYWCTQNNSISKIPTLCEKFHADAVRPLICQFPGSRGVTNVRHFHDALHDQLALIAYSVIPTREARVGAHAKLRDVLVAIGHIGGQNTPRNRPAHIAELLCRQRRKNIQIFPLEEQLKK